MDISPRELLLQLSLNELAELLRECTSSEISMPQVHAMRRVLEQSADLESAFQVLLQLSPDVSAEAA